MGRVFKVVYKKIDPKHYSKRNIMRKSDEVEGDMHWIREVEKSKGGQVTVRRLGCGIEENVRGVNRTKMKSTYNVAHVTCLGCIAAEAGDLANTIAGVVNIAADKTRVEKR